MNKQQRGEDMELNARLKEIGEQLRTQNNRGSDAPVFIVQQKRRDWGYEQGYSDSYGWINESSGEYEEADEEKSRELEEGYDESGETGNVWEKIYYQDRWEYVTACFTEKGCQDYLARNGHNLKEPRIYADTSYRNEEYRTIREALVEGCLPGKQQQVSDE